MKIFYLDEIASTQLYLKQLILKKNIDTPCAVVANIQTDGVGSRENSWIGYAGNLFLSFALDLKELPKDLKLESASIYFAYILKSVLSEFSSLVWLKWPNDFYIKDKKIGGMITTIVDNKLICGVGLNLESSSKEFATLDISVSREELLKAFFKKLKNNISWKQVFSKYKLEFYKNKKYFTHNKDSLISLGDVVLYNDGSIIINNERIYSLR